MEKQFESWHSLEAACNAGLHCWHAVGGWQSYSNMISLGRRIVLPGMVIILGGTTGGGGGGASRIMIGSCVFYLVGRWRITIGGASGAILLAFKRKKKENLD